VSTSGVWALAGALAIASVLMACTTEPRRDLPNVVISPGTTTSESPTLQPAETTVPIEGRLAVIDGSGSLVSLEPDGSDAVVLAAGTSSVGLRQPAWSPDGRRLAWVRLEAAGQEVVSTLATSGPKGERPTRAPARFAPFYLSWDPTSSRVAFLGSRRPSLIELGLVEVAGGRAGIRSLDAGQPYYFSWAPTGEEMLVHVGTDRLERLGLDGTRSTVGEVTGAFRAPAWSADGETMVYASLDGDVQRLIVRDVARDVTGDCCLRARSASSSVPTRPGRLPGVGGEGGARSIIDLKSGKIKRSARARRPRSSGAGRRAPVPVSTSMEMPWFRRGRTEVGLRDEAVLPSPTFAQEYLLFFDQYAQSMTLWAPDGSAFAYPGPNEAGEAGIWAQRPGRTSRRCSP
jgi:TolB protein